MINLIGNIKGLKVFRDGKPIGFIGKNRVYVKNLRPERSQRILLRNDELRLIQAWGQLMVRCAGRRRIITYETLIKEGQRKKTGIVWKPFDGAGAE